MIIESKSITNGKNSMNEKLNNLTYERSVLLFTVGYIQIYVSSISEFHANIEISDFHANIEITYS